jgi:hypothetical protein
LRKHVPREIPHSASSSPGELICAFKD